MKEFWKSVHICQSYYQTSRDVFIYALDLVNYALHLVKRAFDLVKRALDLVIYALDLIKHTLDLINYVLDLVNYEEVYSSYMSSIKACTGVRMIYFYIWGVKPPKKLKFWGRE